MSTINNFQLISVAQLIAQNNRLSYETEDFIEAARAVLAAGWRPANEAAVEQAIHERDQARKDCQRTRYALLPLLPELAVQNAKTTLRAGHVAEEAALELRRLRDLATDNAAVERAARAIAADPHWVRLTTIPDRNAMADRMARAALRAAQGGGRQ